MEIRNINLGLEIREQPEMSLAKDVNRVKMTINGNEHTYIYDQRFTDKDPENYFNVGVKYFNEGKKQYARPIYESDYKYKNTQQQDKELKVYITYEIKLGNISSSLTTKVNSIVDYFDSRFKLESAGTELKENGDTNGNIVSKEGTTVEDSITQNGRTYKKVKLDNKHTDKIKSQKQQSIYVQFSITREQVSRMIEEDRDGTDVLYNIAEINSYSVYDGESGNVYAGIDKKSNPGNCTPGDSSTYQNDTDTAPDIDLTVADRRKLNGAVFEDSPLVDKGQDSSEVMTGKVRQGNGIYDEGKENSIGGVKVTLKEKANSDGMSYETETVEEGYYQIIQEPIEEGTNDQGEQRKYKYTLDKKENNDNDDPNIHYLREGDFYITDFIPGDYEVIYEWGDDNYQVQNYKGTVYDFTRDQNDDKWYKKDKDTKKTDALDDWTIRENIDNQIKNITKDTKENINNAYSDDNNDGNPITEKQMTSTTPKMNITVELGENIETVLKDDGKSADYRVENIDFGIIERAKQHLVLDKYIYKMKVTLANSHVIADLTKDEETGKLVGESKGVTHMLPQPGIQPANGFAKLELDNELMQGTKLEVTYKIEAKNESELDFVDETFYLYGIRPWQDKDIVTIRPTNIVDYLDKGWAVDTEIYKNETTTWDIKTMETENLDGSSTIIRDWVKETVIEYLDDTIGAQTILNTKKMASSELKPQGSKNPNYKDSDAVELNASRVLSTVTDEISLNNHTEEIEVDKKGGRDIETIPGNTIPELTVAPPPGPPPEPDFDTAETVIVTPATGLNLNYIIPIAIGVTALIILGVGVIIIKKKAI